MTIDDDDDRDPIINARIQRYFDYHGFNRLSVNSFSDEYNDVDIVFIFKQFLYLVSPFNCLFVVILFSFLCLSQWRHGGGWRPIGSSASSAIGGRSAGVADRRQ